MEIRYQLQNDKLHIENNCNAQIKRSIWKIRNLKLDIK